MSQYLLNFGRSHLSGKSDGYLAFLWCMAKASQDRGRYSDHIKSYLASKADQLRPTLKLKPRFLAFRSTAAHSARSSRSSRDVKSTGLSPDLLLPFFILNCGSSDVNQLGFF